MTEFKPGRPVAIGNDYNESATNCQVGSGRFVAAVGSPRL
jgi:hypothetical protein